MNPDKEEQEIVFIALNMYKNDLENVLTPEAKKDMPIAYGFDMDRVKKIEQILIRRLAKLKR